MSKQPEALRLAAALMMGRAMIPEIDLPEAAAELRRLQEANKELSEMLDIMLKAFLTYAPQTEGTQFLCVKEAHELIAKHGSKNE